MYQSSRTYTALPYFTTPHLQTVQCTKLFRLPHPPFFTTQHPTYFAKTKPHTLRHSVHSATLTQHQQCPDTKTTTETTTASGTTSTAALTWIASTRIADCLVSVPRSPVYHYSRGHHGSVRSMNQKLGLVEARDGIRVWRGGGLDRIPGMGDEGKGRRRRRSIGKDDKSGL
jgi:hypothetical protein